MNSAKTVINNIIHLPKKFQDLQNISRYSLLKESGYFEIHDLMTVEVIMEALDAHPECIFDWLNWSEDKRTDKGWYFNYNKSGKYQVGYFPESKNIPLLEYSSSNKACATFIKNEMEELRKN